MSRLFTDKDLLAYSQRRLNLIFHGLMAFRDSGLEHYDVLIPLPSSDHVARYGNPQDNPDQPLDGLHPIQPSSGPLLFEVLDVLANAADPAKPSSANAMILRSSMLALQYNNILAVIHVPKPDRIRHYRGAETRGKNLCGDTHTQAVQVAPPEMVHDVTVFSYFTFGKPRMRLPDGNDFWIKKYDAWNLCVYSQPLSKCSGDDNPMFNGMFKIKNDATPLNVDLFLAGSVADGPPTKTAIGIKKIELESLSELRTDHLLTPDPGGCGSAFLCDGDGSGA
jgi:hypothetical protein